MNNTIPTYPPPKAGKLPYERMQPVARDLLINLYPHCQKISIAGSLRRSEKYVSDIEIVCAPNTNYNVDLFGEVTESGRCPDFVSCAKQIGKKIKGGVAGRYTRRQISDKIFLDLFMTTEADFYRQLAIRTGPALYSRLVIATGWNKKGWVGTSEGLRLMKECMHERKEKDGSKSRWLCMTDNPTLPPAWESEEAFFDWIGVKYVAPELRGKG